MEHDAKRQRLILLMETLLRVNIKFTEEMKKPRHFGLDELLYPAEAHMLMSIGSRSGVTVTQLADVVGVTKGAVSQTVARLHEKGLIHREPDPDHSARVLLTLTNKGKIAYYAHETMHEERNRDIVDFLMNMQDEHLAIIERFYTLLERMVDNEAHGR